MASTNEAEAFADPADPQQPQNVTVAINREYTFEAAHQLHWHLGKCRHLHGHSYRLKIAVAGRLDRNGVVMDFADLDKAANPIVDRLDHKMLNDIVVNPTAERVALFIWAELAAQGTVPSDLWLWETSRSSVHLTGLV